MLGFFSMLKNTEDEGKEKKEEGKPSAEDSKNQVPEAGKGKKVSLFAAAIVFSCIFIISTCVIYFLVRKNLSKELSPSEMSEEIETADTFTSDVLNTREAESVFVEKKALVFLLNAYEEQESRMRKCEEAIQEITKGVTDTLGSNSQKSTDLEKNIKEVNTRLDSISTDLAQKEVKLTELETLVGNKKSKEKESIKKLAKLYSTMRPAQIVPIAANLKDDVLIEIFSNMKEKGVADILASLPADRAAKLTAKMGKFDEE
jgi:flagellar motility protein MotE (MotC chaperone)